MELKYASDGNFMGADVYGELRRCFLLPEAAVKLARAHERLKELHPDHRLLVVDGFRPRRVQHRMWELVRGTPMQPYVADPSRGSMHNYGAAVDLTIVDARGERLDMGCPSQPREEQRLLREGRLTAAQVANRRLLRQVMVEAGFIPLEIEWWHFDAFPKQEVRERFAIIE